MNYKLNIQPPGPLVEAAVLIPVVYQAGELHLLLTKRTENVRTHKGQISFPGGAREPQDASLWHTALRETQEEIGLKPWQILYVTELPHLITPTSFHVTPYLGFVHHYDGLLINSDEIDEAFVLPISAFCEKNLRYEDRVYFDNAYPVPFFNCQDREIWGATARIILSLLEMW